jgi:hypothetical protein
MFFSLCSVSELVFCWFDNFYAVAFTSPQSYAGTNATIQTSKPQTAGTGHRRQPLPDRDGQFGNHHVGVMPLLLINHLQAQVMRLMVVRMDAPDIGCRWYFWCDS